METTFENKVSILAELWITYRFDEEFVDFVEYNDLGLPLSFLLRENVVSSTDRAVLLVNETWDLLLASLDIEEDTGFEGIDELLDTE